MLAGGARLPGDHATCPVCGEEGPEGETCVYCGLAEYGIGAQVGLSAGAPGSLADVADARLADSVERLPPALAVRYAFVRDLPPGGQASLSLLLDEETGSLAVLKAYEQRDPRDDIALMERLQALSASNNGHNSHNDHVVQVISYQRARNSNWDLMQYYEHGSLRDFLEAQQGRRIAQKALLRQMIKELAQAIQYVHSNGIRHRDIKPSNILLRSLDPLDLVLTDFGLGKVSATGEGLTSQMRGTQAYMAPELRSRIDRDARDWWALGLVVYEAIVGRHLFSDPNGTLPTDAEIVIRLYNGAFSTEAIEDARLRNLVDGLLTIDPDERWHAKQVLAWLKGEDPPVSRVQQPHATVTAMSWAFTVDGVDWPIIGVDDFDRMLKLHPAEAQALVMQMPDAFRLWLENTPGGPELARVVTTGNMAFGERSLIMQDLIDASSPLFFKGVALTPEGIASAINGAYAGDSSSEDWISDVVDQKILASWGARRRQDYLIAAQNRLVEWRKEAHTIATGLPRAYSAYYSGNEKKALVRLFQAALSRPEGAARHSTSQPSERLASDVLGAYDIVMATSNHSRFGGQATTGFLERVLEACRSGTIDVALEAVASVVISAIKTEAEKQWNSEEAQRWQQIEREQQEREQRRQQETQAREQRLAQEREQRRSQQAARERQAQERVEKLKVIACSASAVVLVLTVMIIALRDHLGLFGAFIFTCLYVAAGGVALLAGCYAFYLHLQNRPN
jgi:serine/threonine protein kinase